MNRDEPPFVPLALHGDIGKRTNVFYGKIKGGAREWVERVVDAFEADGGAFWCVESYENACDNKHGTKLFYRKSVPCCQVSYYRSLPTMRCVLSDQGHSQAR